MTNNKQTQKFSLISLMQYVTLTLSNKLECKSF